MNRVWITLLPVLLLAAGAASGQTTQTRIYTEPAGASFFVDGTKYTSSATFFWPKGSRHTVWAVGVQFTGDTTRMEFTGWADEKSLLTASSSTLTVTADPDFTSLKALFTVMHRIDVLWYNVLANPLPETAVPCDMGGRPGNNTAGNLLPVPAVPAPTGPPPPVTPVPPTPPAPQPAPQGQPGVFMVPGPGALYVNGLCVANSLVVWQPQGSIMSLNAFPARGFVFEGWQVDGIPHTDSFLRNYTVNGPAVVSPRFAPAKRVVIQTEPPGLQVTIDRTLTPTRFPEEIELRYRDSGGLFPIPPWELDFAEGSSHILGAPPTQLDLTGKTWILDSFSIGGGEGTIFKAVGANIPQVIVARFVRGAGVSFLTSPVGLKLNVDGRESWPSYNFVWGVGTRHTVTAPAETTDAKGRKYKFLGWTHGGDATQQITTPEETELGGLRLVARYELYPRAVVSSLTPGSRLQVDGAVCPLPCTLDRPNGTTVTLTVAESVALGADSRMQFDGWNDTPTATRTLSFAGLDQQLSFRYRTFNRMVALADPADGATFRVEPGSADGFYPSDATVQVTAVPAEGYKFRRWEGDLSGTSAGGFLSMLAPRLVRAQLDKVPFIPSAGIRNAAGETPLRAVAPGSIVSIFGSGLANDYVTGSGATLTQTLGGVTARVGTRLLPLLFVSPEQVNAFLPSDLTDGEYTLAVRNGALPEIPGKITVVRNAPGIFGQTIGDQFIATAQRPDGSLAAPDKPAKRGEQIVLMGTGFGAYQRFVLDGFPAADNPPNPLRTPTEILLGDTVFNPDFAGAAPGLAGVSLIRFTIPADWAPGLVEIRVRQAGVESNKALLPLE